MVMIMMMIIIILIIMMIIIIMIMRVFSHFCHFVIATFVFNFLVGF